MTKNNPDMQTIYLSIVIPVRDEQDNIITLLNQIEHALSHSYSYEVIVINHISKDNTGHVLGNYMEKHQFLRVLKIEDTRILLGEAIQHGIMASKGQYLITMDGDLSHPPRFLPQFLKEFNTNHDFVIGGRYSRKQPPFHPISRYYISNLFNLLPRIVLFNKITDFTTGFRGFSRELYDKCIFYCRDFNFHLEINMKLAKCAINPIEIPITYIKRRKGKSKLKYHKQMWNYLRAFLFGLNA